MHKIFITLLATFMFLINSPAHAVNADGIAAIVQDSVITGSELAQRMDMVIKTSNLPRNPEILQRVEDQVLENLIEEKIKILEAERLNLEVTNEEIQQGIGQIAQQNNMTIAEFAGMLKQQKIVPATVAHQVKAQIAWSKVIQQQVRPRIDVTEADIDAKIERLKKLTGTHEYNIAEIFLPVKEDTDEEETKALATRLHKQIASQEAPFPAVAQQFSQNTSARRGGLVGWVQEGQLAETLEVALKQQTQTGVLLPPIRSESGYHIILLQDKRKIEFDESTTNMLVLRAEILNEIGQERLEINAKRYLTDMKASTFIERRV